MTDSQASQRASVESLNSQPVQEESLRQISELNYRYAQALDDCRFDDWLEFFTDDALYVIHPRNNRDAGLEGYIIYCNGRRMLEDRVLSLKEVNLYNIHFDRHFLSNVVVDEDGPNRFRVRANYMVVQTNDRGHGKIFSAGEYRDVVVVENGTARFAEKIVVPDTFAVDTLLAIPL